MGRRKVTIILKEEPHPMVKEKPYVVSQVTNSTEWDMGSRLSKDEVDRILNRNGRYEVRIK